VTAKSVTAKPKEKPLDLYSSALSATRSPMSTHQRHEKGRSPAPHKFKVGQILQFSPSIFEPAMRKGSYSVVRLLPADGGDNQYRLKSEFDGHERVVREGQLSA